MAKSLPQGAADPKWASGLIRPTLASKAGLNVFLAMICTAFSVPIVILVPRELAAKGPSPAIVAFVFPLVAIGFTVAAIRSLIRVRKFGRCYLQLQTVPGVVGGHLTGEIAFVGQLMGIQSIEATLRCLKTVHERRGKDSHTETETLWKDTRLLCASAILFGQQELRVPVDFQIPGTCRPCDDSDKNNMIWWRLDVNAATPGVDLALEFIVPVYCTEASDPTLGESPEKLAAEQLVIDNAASPAPRKIRMLSESTGEVTFVTSAFPSVGFFSLMVLVTGVFTAATVFFAYQVYHHNWFLLIFLGGFGLFSLILWLIVLSCFGSHRLTFEADALRRQRRWGPLRWGRKIGFDEVQDIRYEQCASSGGGERRWYRVYAQVSGRKVTLAGMVPGEVAAKWYVNQVLQRTTAGQQTPAT